MSPYFLSHLAEQSNGHACSDFLNSIGTFESNFFKFMQSVRNDTEDFKIVAARSVKIVWRVLFESQLKFDRKSFCALELQILFHANNPAAA